MHKEISINRKNLLSGLMFASFGLVGIVIGSSYEIGTALRMGPAYFPLLVSILLFIAGAGLFLTSLFSGPDNVELGSLHVIVLPLLGIVGFGLLVGPAGFLLGMLPPILLTYRAFGRGKLIEFAFLYILLTAGSYLLFGVFLKLPLSLLP